MNSTLLAVIRDDVIGQLDGDWNRYGALINHQLQTLRLVGEDRFLAIVGEHVTAKALRTSNGRVLKAFAVALARETVTA